MDAVYQQMLSGGGFSAVMNLLTGGDAPWPTHWNEGIHLHAAVMLDGDKKRIWVHIGEMRSTDFYPDNPNIMWFDTIEEADAWVLACWRMR